MTLTWDKVHAWRMRRHFLDAPANADVAAVVHRLCGVQAQVASSAELAVGLRQRRARRGAVERALAGREVVRTWAMRGTLHLLTPVEGAAYLSLIAAARTWEKGVWQRTFVTSAQLDALTDAVYDVLDGQVLSREELVDAVVDRTGDAHLAEQLRSGWGAVLKPLAWQGYLCQGPGQGNRVTFTRPDTYLPDWPGIPEPADAARVAIPAYLGSYGPASMAAFDQWLIRGASKKAALRGWFADLGDALTVVEVEGVSGYARSTDVDEIAGIRPSSVVRLIGGFDQYVLGPGTNDAHLLAPARRSLVSKAAGWISPVVLVGGRVAGTWEHNGGELSVALFDEAGPVDAEALEAEVERIGAFLGDPLKLGVRTV